MDRRRRLSALHLLLAGILGAGPGWADPVPPPGSGSPTGALPAPDHTSPAQAPAPPAPAAQTPSATTEPPPAQTPGPTPAPQNLEPLPPDQVVPILGKKVVGPKDEDMGRVVDLLFDREARPRAVVIDFGGFLGVGSRKIAIDWQLLHFDPTKPDAPVSLDLDKAEVQAAPEYKDGAQPPLMVGPPPAAPDAAR